MSPKFKLLTAALLCLSPVLGWADAETPSVTVKQGYATPFSSTQSPALQPRHRDYSDDRYYYLSNIDMTLYRDRDHDGYFSGFELITDVDVEYGAADVWLEIWIRPYGGYYEHLLTSDRFVIEGAAAADTYLIDASLDYDIPADYYDVLVELHTSGSHDDTPVAVADAYTYPQLSLLPLESTRSYHDSSSVYVSAYGAGSAGPALLIVAAAIALARRRRTI